MTDADGHFNLTLLPPGTYTITATLPGLRRRRPQTVHLALGPGGVDHDRLGSPRRRRKVTVTAQAVPVETESNSIGRNLDAKVFEALPDGPQLRLRRAARRRRQHRRLGHAQHVDHGLRLDGAREQLSRRRRQHDRRRDRQPGQDPELRVHPGGRVQVGRLRGGVRRRAGRHPQRRHEVRRQRVPRRRLRLLQRPDASRRRTSTSSESDRRRHPDRLLPRTTTARTSAASS